MAGHLFPLLLKLKLAFKQQYDLDGQDKQRLLSIDQLLAEPDWVSHNGHEVTPWQRIHNDNLMAGHGWPQNFPPSPA